MLISILFIALLFLAGLLTTFFGFPTHKIYGSLLQFLSSKTVSNITSCTKTTTPTSSTEFESSFSPSPKKKEELRKVFATFDKNGDGFITRQELRESLRNIRIFMSDKEVDDIVVKFDSNGDGLIDFDEFCLLTSESMGGQLKESEENEVSGEEEENLKEAFDVFDKDQDGVISVEELALVLTSLGLREGKKMEDCKEMIKKVDMDGDGMVDFHEFKTMMKARKFVFAS